MTLSLKSCERQTGATITTKTLCRTASAFLTAYKPRRCPKQFQEVDRKKQSMQDQNRVDMSEQRIDNEKYIAANRNQSELFDVRHAECGQYQNRRCVSDDLKHFSGSEASIGAALQTSFCRTHRLAAAEPVGDRQHPP